MLNTKEIIVPLNLIKLAKKTSPVLAGIVCAHHKTSMQSAKKAFELKLINPILIGKKHLIQEEADRLKWDTKKFTIINENTAENAALSGAILSRENKIKVLVKGNIHTDVLMRIYLKKEFGLIGTKRLSHIWHMSLDVDDKPLFITDGALNVSPRLDVKMHILRNAIEFTKKIIFQKPRVAVLSGTEDPIKSMPSSIEAKEITFPMAGCLSK